MKKLLLALLIGIAGLGLVACDAPNIDTNPEVVVISITKHDESIVDIEQPYGTQLRISNPEEIEGFVFKGYAFLDGADFDVNIVIKENISIKEVWEKVVVIPEPVYPTYDVPLNEGLNGKEFILKDFVANEGKNIGQSASGIKYNEMFSIATKDGFKFITQGSAYSYGGFYGDNKVLILQASIASKPSYVEFEVDQDYEISLTIRAWKNSQGKPFYQNLILENDGQITNLTVVDQDQENTNTDAVIKTFLVKKGTVKISHNIVFSIYDAKLALEKISFVDLDNPIEEENTPLIPLEPSTPVAPEETLLTIDDILTTKDRKSVKIINDGTMTFITIRMYKKDGLAYDNDHPMAIDNLSINGVSYKLSGIFGMPTAAAGLGSGKFQIGDYFFNADRVTYNQKHLRIKSTNDEIGYITFDMTNIDEIEFELLFPTESSLKEYQNIIITRNK